MGSAFGGTGEDAGGVFLEVAVKRALKQDQIVHMEENLQVILYFSREGVYGIIDSCCSLRTTLNPIPKRALEPN